MSTALAWPDWERCVCMWEQSYFMLRPTGVLKLVWTYRVHGLCASAVNAIPYKTISEIDFTKPKSIIRRCKRAYINNDREILTDSGEIEVLDAVSKKQRASSTFDPNMVPPQEDDKQSFLVK